jgi:hypothetical protein
MGAQEYIQPVSFFKKELPVVEDSSEGAYIERTGVDEYSGKLRSALGQGMTALKAAAVTIELLPVTNEGLRYAAFMYSQTYSHNPILGAAVLGGSTALIEGAGALAAANWVAKDRIKNVIDGVDNNLANTKLAFLSPKRHIPEQLHISPLAEAGVAMTLGSVALLEAKQRENPERTAAQNRRRGLGTAAWLGGVFAIEGGLLSEGIESYHNPTTVGLVLLGLAGMMAVGRWIKKRVRLNTTQEKGE